MDTVRVMISCDDGRYSYRRLDDDEESEFAVTVPASTYATWQVVEEALRTTQCELKAYAGGWLPQAIATAARRAAHDRTAAFVVYVDEASTRGYVYHADDKTPLGARFECVVQFWSENADGSVQVQIRRPHADSSWLVINPACAKNK